MAQSGGFWGQMKRGMGKVAAGAEKQTAIAKLNLDIRGAQGNIRKQIEGMGKAALDLYRQGQIGHPQLLGYFEEVQRLEAEVAELEDQIAEIRAGAAE